MLGLVPAMRNIASIYACSFLLCTHAFMESICTHAEDKWGSICPVWHLWLFFFFTFEANFDNVLLCFVSTFNISQCSGLSLGNQNHINDSCSYMKRKFLQAMKHGSARSAPPVTSSRGQEQFWNCRRGVLKTWNDRRGRQIPLCPVEKLTAPCLSCRSFQISVSLNISLAFSALRYRCITGFVLTRLL